MRESTFEFAGVQRASESLPFAPVLALHCSGSDGSQWSSLRAELDKKAAIVTPDFMGTTMRGRAPTAGGFHLKDEAEHILNLVEETGEAVHLVGHSYGGAVALHIACEAPDLVRSLCLYEPTLFSLLLDGSAADQVLYEEIVRLAESLRSGIEEGFHEFAAEVFTDFWGGIGAWLALSRRRQEAMIDWIPKAPLDFEALLNEPEPGRIRDFPGPMTLLVGAQTHPHTSAVAELLSRMCTRVRLRRIPGADHLGPFKMRDTVNGQIKDHLAAAEN